LGKTRHAQRRRILLRARDATPAARENAGEVVVERGVIPQVYQELLDIFWPSRLRQQMLSVSPLSCSYFDMAQAWGYSPSPSSASSPAAGGGAGTDDGGHGDTGAAAEGAGQGGDEETDDDDDGGHRAGSGATGGGTTSDGGAFGADARQQDGPPSDWSVMCGTILFPANRNYLAFRFEFVIAAVLKKHQTFFTEWCVTFRNSTFHKNFIEQFCQCLHHFPSIQSLTFCLSKAKQQRMRSNEFDRAIYAMLVPGVLPEWINW
jgi:hypothetical protein